MLRKNFIMSAAAIGLLASTAACTTDPVTGEKKISKAAIGAALGAGAGFLAGDIIGGKGDRTEKIVGVGIGAIAGGAIGSYMDKQEKELREKTAGTGVEVVRQGDELQLNMPAGITFAFGQSTIQPQFQGTLNQVAQTLSQYNSTYIDVIGHTDSVGSDAANQTLSEQRAASVANYLSGQGVNRARIATSGMGESQPVASNDTEVGRAQNRRVNIRVVPVTQQDVSAR
ncbi:OmpA family protein [Sphingoaurantiacus capsulatus]|uniref:OmpA family protein n=1 Tax=Sphingoaurantiacus capsulatus TaxID=1771310 RepID=A0ABV7XAD4_9SPHN